MQALAGLPNDDPEAGPSKRRRSTVSKIKSCAECRRLKLKCDRQVPCNNCGKRGTASICPHGALKSGKGRTLILESNEVLHDRIASLERALQTATSATGPHPLLANAYHLDLGDDSSEPDLAGPELPWAPPDNVPVAPPDNSPIVQVSINTAPPEVAAKPDSRGSSQEEERYGHLRIDSSNKKTSQFFGDASSLYLATSRQASDGPGETDGLYTFRPGWVEAFVFERDSALKAEYTLRGLMAGLPVRQETERLVNIYFENVAWGTAIVDKSSFIHDILAHCYTGQLADPQRLAVLYLVMALGSLFDPSASSGANNNPYTRDFFALGRGCLSLDSSASLLFVQAVHLMVTWLSNGGRAVSSAQSTWPLLGMAMRVVQSLGLHRDGSHFDFSPSDVEERRRIFWELYSYDVVQASMSGRPRSMTSLTFEVVIPRTAEDGDCSRYRISNDILSRINDQQTLVTSTPYEKVLEIDRDLRKFLQQLPTQLSRDEYGIPQDITKSRTHKLQRHAIRFQCNIASLILHRVWFARAIIDEPDEPLRCKYSASFVGCLEACKLIINVARQLSTEFPLICQRRWFFLFHTFTACACLAAAVIRAPQSMLAHSSLLALEDGLRLFEEAGRAEELVILVPLRETARQSFTHSGQAQPANDEDLALLGKGSRRAGSAPKSITPTASAPADPMLAVAPTLASSAPPLRMPGSNDTVYGAAPGSMSVPSVPVSSDLYASSMATLMADFGGGQTMSTGPDAGGGGVPGSAAASQRPSFDSPNWFNSAMALGDFDLDNFLEASALGGV